MMEREPKMWQQDEFSDEREMGLMSAEPPGRASGGVRLTRHFTRAGEQPFSAVEWERRS